MKKKNKKTMSQKEEQKNILKNNFNETYINIYLKGMLMGICDLIPGISGGTIAFITGIYERLITAIHNLTPNKYLKLLFSIKNKNNFLKIFKQLDTLFLLVLFLGIMTSILLASNIISYLLDNWKSYVLAFFIGLIVASSKIIYDEIENHSSINIFHGLIGFLIGTSFVFFVPKELSNPSYLYVMLSGFLAIFALFLPGISGSFILLVMGTYGYIINQVKNIIIGYKALIPFAIGAIGGVFIISRVIKWLFEKDRCKTLYVLLGLVLGSLSVPFLEMIYLTENNFITYFTLFILFLVGFFIVKLISKKN